MMEHWMFEHVFSMSRVLAELSRLGLVLHAYLPSLKDLSRRWPAFVQEHCPNYHPSEGFLPKIMPRRGLHFSSRDPFGSYRAATQVWKEGGSTAQALCYLHAMDYACWRNLQEIPPLCQQVYESDFFRENLWEALQSGRV